MCDAYEEALHGILAGDLMTKSDLEEMLPIIKTKHFPFFIANADNLSNTEYSAIILLIINLPDVPLDDFVESAIRILVNDLHVIVDLDRMVFGDDADDDINYIPVIQRRKLEYVLSITKLADMFYDVSYIWRSNTNIYLDVVPLGETVRLLTEYTSAGLLLINEANGHPKSWNRDPAVRTEFLGLITTGSLSPGSVRPTVIIDMLLGCEFYGLEPNMTFPERPFVPVNVFLSVFIRDNMDLFGKYRDDLFLTLDMMGGDDPTKVYLENLFERENQTTWSFLTSDH